MGVSLTTQTIYSDKSEAEEETQRYVKGVNLTLCFKSLKKNMEQNRGNKERHKSSSLDCVIVDKKKIV